MLVLCENWNLIGVNQLISQRNTIPHPPSNPTQTKFSSRHRDCHEDCTSRGNGIAAGPHVNYPLCGGLEMQSFSILRLKCLTALDSSGKTADMGGGKMWKLWVTDWVVYYPANSNCNSFAFLHSKRICWICCFPYIPSRVFVLFSGENGKKVWQKTQTALQMNGKLRLYSPLPLNIMKYSAPCVQNLKSSKSPNAELWMGCQNGFSSVGGWVWNEAAWTCRRKRLRQEICVNICWPTEIGVKGWRSNAIWGLEQLFS